MSVFRSSESDVVFELFLAWAETIRANSDKKKARKVRHRPGHDRRMMAISTSPQHARRLVNLARNLAPGPVTALAASATVAALPNGVTIA